MISKNHDRLYFDNLNPISFNNILEVDATFVKPKEVMIGLLKNHYFFGNFNIFLKLGMKFVRPWAKKP